MDCFSQTSPSRGEDWRGQKRGGGAAGAGRSGATRPGAQGPAEGTDKSVTGGCDSKSLSEYWTSGDDGLEMAEHSFT